MAISIDDIKKLRAMTGAGLADVKKALTEAEGDFDKAKELLRERGLAIAAKRSDRETSNGCVLVKSVDGFAAMIALKCETDFVANGADFIALTQSILDAAIAAKAKDVEAVKELTLADGQKVQDAVTQRSGITGEKMELDGYLTLEGENIEVYNHMGKNTLCTMVQTNKPAAEQGHLVAMQVAAMKPVALDAQSIDPKILDEEYKTAVEKTKLEQVEKFVEMKENPSILFILYFLCSSWNSSRKNLHRPCNLIVFYYLSNSFCWSNDYISTLEIKFYQIFSNFLCRINWHKFYIAFNIIFPQSMKSKYRCNTSMACINHSKIADHEF